MIEVINFWSFYTTLGWDNIRGYFINKIDQIKGAFVK